MAQLETQLIEQLYAQHKGQLVLNSTQRGLSWAEQQHGNVRIDDLADLAGLSARQFRRVCLGLTGLTPFGTEGQAISTLDDSAKKHCLYSKFIPYRLGVQCFILTC